MGWPRFFARRRPSPAPTRWIREPEGNGCAERFIRVLKENLLWVRRFDTLEELRLALQAFRQTYQPDLDHRAARLPVCQTQVRADQLGQTPMAA